MEILVGDDFKITEAIKKEIHQKIEQIESHLSHKADIRVRLQMTGDIFHIQMQYTHRKANFVATSENRDFHVALNDVKNKLQRQIDNHTKKKKAYRLSL